MTRRHRVGTGFFALAVMGMLAMAAMAQVREHGNRATGDRTDDRTTNRGPATTQAQRILELLPYPVDRAPDPCNTNGCLGLDDPTGCAWYDNFQALGDCDAAGLDPVETRLCQMGIIIDGDISDAIANGVVFMVDRVPDFGNPRQIPGPSGDREQPRSSFTGPDPNGFNIASTGVLFAPDTDPRPDVDNSFLYIVLDISDFDLDSDTPPIPPAPFDSDDDASACTISDTNATLADGRAESYSLRLQACARLDEFIADADDPNFIFSDFDLGIDFLIHNLIEEPLQFVAEPVDAGSNALLFPTPYDPLGPPAGPANLTDGCIDRERRFCAVQSADNNNIEILLKSVETRGFADLDPRVARYALSRLIVSLDANSEGDRSDEELANVAFQVAVPSIEVEKLVRCDDDGPTDYRAEVQAFPASTLGFQITVTNKGNANLDVSVTDEMSCLTPNGNPTLEPICGTLSAVFTDSNGVEHPITPANASFYGLDSLFFVDDCDNPNLGFLGAIRTGQPIRLGLLDATVKIDRLGGACVLTDLPTKLVIEFKAKGSVEDESAFCEEFLDPDCLNAIRADGAVQPFPAATLGNLCQEDYQCDDGLYCNGEEICIPGLNVCGQGLEPCTAAEGCNEVTDSCGNVVSDVPFEKDTEYEMLVVGRDDNVTSVGLLCRDISFEKQVGLVGQPGTYTTGDDALNLPTPSTARPLQIEFRYVGTNLGELPEDVVIADENLCGDITDTQSAFPGELTVIDCPLCPAGSITIPNVAPGADFSVSCIIEFATEEALVDFLMRDDGRDCTADPAPGVPNPDCYRNCASATADPNPGGLGDVCDGAPSLDRTSYAEVCYFGCQITVLKEVRCLTECDPSLLGPEEGWVQDPAQLPAGAYACLEYRITVTNTSPPEEDVAVCALRWTDCMINSNAFAEGPIGILMEGDSVCDGLDQAFNWDCVPVVCDLVDPGDPQLPRNLEPGEQVVLRFIGRLQSPDQLNFDEDPDNQIRVDAAPEGECVDPYVFSCNDDSDVSVDVQECNFDLTKEVACAEPRLPNGQVNAAADWQPTLVDTLPGARVSFRFDITNTGDMPISVFDITDSLDCDGWYIPGTVVATIGGDDVTDCICTDQAGCLDFTGLSGPKDLAGAPPCTPDAIGVGETLVVTFEIKVPADFDTMGTPVDCTNNVSVTFFNNVCQLTGSNPCPTKSAEAAINVDVPDIACDKSVCADVNNDGDCDDVGDYVSTNALRMACDVNDMFPIQLIYDIVADNTGETPYSSIEICDEDLIQHVIDTPGVDFGDCPMSTTGCVTLPVPPADVLPGGTVSTQCKIIFQTQAAWEAFALSDGGAVDCHTNSVEVTGNINTTDLCSREAVTTKSSSCEAEACLSPPCEIDVEKTVRCIDNCDDRNVVGVNTNALIVTPGAAVEYEYRITNTGVPGEDPGVCMIELTDTRVGAFEYCPLAPCVAELVKPTGTLPCVLPPECFAANGVPCEINLPDACGAELEPGDELFIYCAGEIPDDATSGITSNEVMVNGAPDCPADGDEAVYCCDAEDDAVIDVRTCGLSITKDVTCDEPRLAGGDYNDAADWRPDIVDALPGAVVGMGIELCNTGEVPLTQFELSDVPDCDWYVADSVVVTLGPSGADDVTECFCPGGSCGTLADLGNPGDLTACVPEGLLPGECLYVTFEMKVPEDFDVRNTAVDCTNTVTVEGATDVCRDFEVNPCPQDMDTAAINVLVPEIACIKEVCADINNDGDCDDPPAGDFPGDFGYSSALQMTCNVTDDQFPITLDYRITANNLGETAFQAVTACDPELVADAVAAGAIVDPCDLCDNPPPCDGSGDDCADLGPIPVGGSGEAHCRIMFPTRVEWLAFASLDNDDNANCYANEVEVVGEVDTTDICFREAETMVPTSCEADVCLSPPCVLETTKQFQCIDSCADRTPIGDPADVLTAAAGATVEFIVAAENIGTDDDPSICVLRFTDTLTGDFVPCPDNFCRFEIATESGPIECPVPPDCFKIDGTPCEVNLEETCGRQLDPGDTIRVRCAGTIPDGSTNEITNAVRVEGAPDCPPAGPVYCCEDDDEAAVVFEECDFDLVKDVTCGDPRDPGAVFVENLMAFEDTPAGFRFRVINTGSASIPELEVFDDLGCPSWYEDGSLVCDINGDPITPCMCDGGNCLTISDLNGLKDLTDCPHGPLEPGETLTCTFRVNVPENVGSVKSCENTIRVEPSTDICVDQDNNPCGEKEDDASIQVKVPAFHCEKTITADYAEDTEIDDGPTDSLIIPDDAPYPMILDYRFTLYNDGDTDLINAQICDPDLVNDVLIAGAEIVSCDLCTGACDGVDDTCADVGTIPVGDSATINCKVRVTSPSQLETWAPLDDGDDEGYLNTAGFAVNVATNGICGEAPELEPAECDAYWGFKNIPPPCWPLTKATMWIWNQNEIKFTGLHRCVVFWDQHLLSLYGIPNHFLRQNLHTDKGKARIDGIASQLCLTDEIESIPAPVIGVIERRLSFNGVLKALTGMPLVGMGAEEGGVRYTLRSNGAERPAGIEPRTEDRGRLARPKPVQAVAPDGEDPLPVSDSIELLPTGTPIGHTTNKGSLIVYPDVVVRWTDNDGQWRLTRDTFIELTNDFPDPVFVQMYFVNGDKPLDADDITGERGHPGCNWVDVGLTLTANQPTYWSVATGAPAGVSPWSILDPGNPPGRPADDGSGDRVLRGFVLAWAAAPVVLPNGSVQMREIAWNHLAGSATIVDYGIGDAWTYTPWAFQALSAARGEETDNRPGSLRLDGAEYEAAPAMLLMDFYATDGTPFSTPGITIDTDSELTLMPMLQDVRER